jgi:hypothetical protein
MLANVIDAIDGTGSPRCFVPLAPAAGSERLGPRIEALGLRYYNNWMRLRRNLEDLTDLPSAPAPQLEIRQIGVAHAPAFGQVVATAFDHPPAIAPLTSQTIGRPRWHSEVRRPTAASRSSEAATSSSFLAIRDFARFAFQITMEKKSNAFSR